MRFNHSNKHIRDAIRYAEGKNWRVTKAGPRAHIWGKLWCPHRARDGCRTQVLSTPKTLNCMRGISAATLTDALILVTI